MEQSRGGSAATAARPRQGMGIPVSEKNGGTRIRGASNPNSSLDQSEANALQLTSIPTTEGILGPAATDDMYDQLQRCCGTDYGVPATHLAKATGTTTYMDASDSVNRNS